MAYVISDDCVACGTCIDECPVGAISEGEKYSIPNSAQSAALAQTLAQVVLSLSNRDFIPTRKPFSNEGLFVYSLWKPVFISIVPKKRAFLP